MDPLSSTHTIPKKGQRKNWKPKGRTDIMWRLSLVCNVVVMVLLWLLSEVAVTPAYNLLVQYGETGSALPMLTDIAFQVRPYARVLPLLWLVITLLWGRWIGRQPVERRTQGVVVHTSATLCVGLLLLLFFAIAGMLPALKIGATLH